MVRTVLVPATGIGPGAGGTTAAHHNDDGESVKLLSATDINETSDGTEANATVVGGGRSDSGGPACRTAVGP